MACNKAQEPIDYAEIHNLIGPPPRHSAEIPDGSNMREPLTTTQIELALSGFKRGEIVKVDGIDYEVIGTSLEGEGQLTLKPIAALWYRQEFDTEKGAMIYTYIEEDKLVSSKEA